jgi:hypothetical protein
MIIKLQGGLGNQMFQYAFGRRESIKKNQKLTLDLEYLVFPERGETPRAFRLNVFNIQAAIIEPKRRGPVRRFFAKLGRKILKKNSYYQSEKYFKDIEEIIRKDFTLKHPLGDKAEQIARLINQNHSAVALHIRRTDYVTDPATNRYHGVVEADYYRRAADYLIGKDIKPEFFVFSDDIDWAKKNLDPRLPTTFVSDGEIKDYEELFLMSLCRHHIIANSSFSWWGAWLDPRPDKIVIAPCSWFAAKSRHDSDIVPAEWIRL